MAANISRQRSTKYRSATNQQTANYVYCIRQNGKIRSDGARLRGARTLTFPPDLAYDHPDYQSCL